jgi:hypothetical protein
MAEPTPGVLVNEPFYLRPRWNQIRDIGNSTIAKSSLAIPVIGYLLIFNEHVVDYLRIHSDFCRGSSCESSWRLYFFYFGSCFFAIGSLLYAGFCPVLIKKYKDAAAFFEAEKEFLSHSTKIAYLFARIEEVKGSPYKDHLGTLQSLVGANEGLSSRNFNLLAGAMSEHYYLENRRRSIVRLATFVFYVIGGLLLAIPTVMTAIQIFKAAVERLT